MPMTDIHTSFMLYLSVLNIIINPPKSKVSCCNVLSIQLYFVAASSIIGVGEKIPANTKASPDMNAHNPANGRIFLTPATIVAPNIKYEKCENSMGYLWSALCNPNLIDLYTSNTEDTATNTIIPIFLSFLKSHANSTISAATAIIVKDTHQYFIVSSKKSFSLSYTHTVPDYVICFLEQNVNCITIMYCKPFLNICQCIFLILI